MKWVTMDESQREQWIALDVFGLPVDPAYGKIVEQKESGGIRLVALPDAVKKENAKTGIREHMENLGWRVETMKLPRSTRSIVSMFHEKRNLEVKSTDMPEEDAMRFCALLVFELEKEMAHNEVPT